MIELRDHALEFRFPEVHPRARCQISFQRTLRIPDDNQPYPLPAGLGRFPLHHVDDYYQRLPASWEQHGGVFLPLYQSEALWLDFSRLKAARVAGKIMNSYKVVRILQWDNGFVATIEIFLPSVDVIRPVLNRILSLLKFIGKEFSDLMNKPEEVDAVIEETLDESIH